MTRRLAVSVFVGFVTVALSLWDSTKVTYAKETPPTSRSKGVIDMHAHLSPRLLAFTLRVLLLAVIALGTAFSRTAAPFLLAIGHPARTGACFLFVCE